MSIGPFEAPTPTLLLRISCGFAMIMMWGYSSGLCTPSPSGNPGSSLIIERNLPISASTRAAVRNF